MDERTYDEKYIKALNNRYAIDLIAIGLKIINAKGKCKTKYNNVKIALVVFDLFIEMIVSKEYIVI